jgi:hypothetical protein
MSFQLVITSKEINGLLERLVVKNITLEYINMIPVNVVSKYIL